MVDAQLALGVEVMTGHWEFTYGMERVKQVVDGAFKGRIAFVAQNVKTTDFGDPVFEPYVMRELNGVPVAIVGQAFPYTPIANPRYFVADWSFGIQDEQMQKTVDDARAKGAQIVALLSHNGMDVDLKIGHACARHRRDLQQPAHRAACRWPCRSTRGGPTSPTQAATGSSSACSTCGVLDGRLREWTSATVCCRCSRDLLPPDTAMAALIARVRAPHAAKLAQRLAITDRLLYGRGNFNGSRDQVVLDALMR